MSSRERWTIYPLLFLALGAALRGKHPSTFDAGTIKSDQLAARSIQCDDMVVLGHVVIVDQDGRARLSLGRTPRTGDGGLEIYSRDGRVVANLAADPAGHAGMLTLQSADGRPQVSLGSGTHGGLVEIVDESRATKVDFDSRGITPGIFVEGLNDHFPPRRPTDPRPEALPQK